MLRSTSIFTRDAQAFWRTSRNEELLRVSGRCKTLVPHELCGRLGTSFSICRYHVAVCLWTRLDAGHYCVCTAKRCSKRVMAMKCTTCEAMSFGNS